MSIQAAAQSTPAWGKMLQEVRSARKTSAQAIPGQTPLREKVLPGSHGRKAGVNTHPANIAIKSPRLLNHPNRSALDTNPPPANPLNRNTRGRTMRKVFKA
jgi:hypothetical protein